MGAEPWNYFVPYEPDAQAALDKLKQEVFESGEYYPLTWPRFYSTAAPPSIAAAFEQGRARIEAISANQPRPETIDDAREMAEESGTMSILDIDTIGDAPDYGVVAPLSLEALSKLYGTDKPTHAMLGENWGYYENIQRGQGAYTVVYDDQGQPSEWLFAGYSYD